MGRSESDGCDGGTGSSALRSGMVELLRSRGVAETWVLDAMGSIPREDFVGSDQSADAYRDGPLPIGHGQTISQPYVVAIMAEAARVSPDDRVLEVGTGSGYGAAVLAWRAGSVVTIERLPALAATAKARLARHADDRRRLGQPMAEVDVVVGDGTLGWPAGAPYDVVIVTAGGPHVPRALLDQMADGARLIMPVGGRRGQRLHRVTRRGDGYDAEDLGAVRFVPLVGRDGRRG